MIEDQRARQLCIDVRHSMFYETCATYGFNVDRVFLEGRTNEILLVFHDKKLNCKMSTINICYETERVLTTIFQLLRRL